MKKSVWLKSLGAIIFSYSLIYLITSSNEEIMKCLITDSCASTNITLNNVLINTTGSIQFSFLLMVVGLVLMVADFSKK